MLQPKKTKFRKSHKLRKSVLIKRIQPNPIFGECGLQILEPGLLTARQIETVRRIIVQSLGRQGKIWFRIFPDQPQTKKPNEVRMGRGKGDVKEWGAKVRPGRIFVEISGLDNILLKRALKKIQYKLSFKTRIIFRNK